MASVKIFHGATRNVWPLATTISTNQTISQPNGYHFFLFCQTGPTLLREPLIKSLPRKIPPQGSPTLQVVRLTRYRTNYPSSIHSPTVPLLCCVPFVVILAIVVPGGGGKSREKSKIVTTEAPPCLPRLGNSHPCRNVTPPQAKMMKCYKYYHISTV